MSARRQNHRASCESSATATGGRQDRRTASVVDPCPQSPARETPAAASDMLSLARRTDVAASQERQAAPLHHGSGSRGGSGRLRTPPSDPSRPPRPFRPALCRPAAVDRHGWKTAPLHHRPSRAEVGGSAAAARHRRGCKVRFTPRRPGSADRPVSSRRVHTGRCRDTEGQMSREADLPLGALSWETPLWDRSGMQTSILLDTYG